jgi:type I restriction enzyme, S subunit
MEIKASYKQTEVGIIPEDWSIQPLLDISTMHGRIGWQGLKQSEFTMNTEDPFLITGMNFKDGDIRWDEVYHIPVKRYEEAKQIQLRNDDVLITKDGTIGKTLYIDAIPFPGKASLNSHLLVFRPLGNRYIPKYLYYQLNSQTFLNHVEQEKSGSTFFGITQEAMGKFQIPLPPTEAEQTAIAEALSDADALIAGLEKLIAKKRNIKQGAMKLLLTGKKRLPGFSGEWKVKRLGEIADINMGQSPDSRYYNTNAEGIPLIQGNADIDNRKSIKRIWTSQKTKICDAGDLIMTVRAPVGAIGIAVEYSCIGRGVCSFKPKNANRNFLFHLLIFNENKWKIVEQGSTFTAANSDQIRTFTIKIPIEEEEQTAIAQVLTDMDMEIEELERKLTKYKLIKQGMMQELLTGKKRLI